MPTNTWFIDDKCVAPRSKNDELTKHLAGAWSDLDIVSIRRIDGDDASGWEAEYLV